MTVTIELFGSQRDITGTDKIDVPITDSTTVHDALGYVTEKYPSLDLDSNNIFVTVNNELTSPDRLLNPADVISIYPHIGGG